MNDDENEKSRLPFLGGSEVFIYHGFTKMQVEDDDMGVQAICNYFSFILICKQPYVCIRTTNI